MTKISLFFMFSLFSIGSMQSAARQIDQKLINASAYGTLKDVQQALDQHANPNIPDPVFGRTPLFYALANDKNPEQVEIIQALLKAKADPNSKDNFSPALTLIVRFNKDPNLRQTLLRLFLSAGANTENTDEYDTTALIWTILHQYPQDCKILLQAGAQIPDKSFLLAHENGWLHILWLDNIIKELNEENRKNAKFIQEFLALQPAGTILPVMDALYSELDTKQYPLASEVYAARKIQRVSKKMLARKKLKK